MLTVFIDSFDRTANGRIFGNLLQLLTKDEANYNKPLRGDCISKQPESNRYAKKEAMSKQQMAELHQPKCVNHFSLIKKHYLHIAGSKLNSLSPRHR